MTETASSATTHSRWVEFAGRHYLLATGEGCPRTRSGMVLLARFAIADDHQGQGLGRDLLIEAIERAADAGTQGAARFIAVDPIDENARAFYDKFAFKQIRGRRRRPNVSPDR